MRAVVIYESMFGNTHEVAERIGAGLRTEPEFEDVEVISVAEAIGRVLSDVDLVVVGGPTHAHGVSRPSTRKSASEQAENDPDLDLEPDADSEPWLAGFSGARDDRELDPADQGEPELYL